MLDWAHSLVLRAVEQGDSDDCPALRNLVAAGLVRRAADGSCTVTPAGRVALEVDRPTRWERIALPLMLVVGALFAVTTIVQWAT